MMLIDNNDGTISDQHTGLMWQKNRWPDKLTIEKAFSISKCLFGYNDWRLPTSDELKSITPINEKYFSAPTRGYYLSCTRTKNTIKNNFDCYPESVTLS